MGSGYSNDLQNVDYPPSRHQIITAIETSGAELRCSAPRETAESPSALSNCEAVVKAGAVRICGSRSEIDCESVARQLFYYIPNIGRYFPNTPKAFIKINYTVMPELW